MRSAVELPALASHAAEPAHAKDLADAACIDRDRTAGARAVPHAPRPAVGDDHHGALRHPLPRRDAGVGNVGRQPNGIGRRRGECRRRSRAGCDGHGDDRGSVECLERLRAPLPGRAGDLSLADAAGSRTELRVLPQLGRSPGRPRVRSRRAPHVSVAEPVAASAVVAAACQPQSRRAERAGVAHRGIRHCHRGRTDGQRAAEFGGPRGGASRVGARGKAPDLPAAGPGRAVLRRQHALPRRLGVPAVAAAPQGRLEPRVPLASHERPGAAHLRLGVHRRLWRAAAGHVRTVLRRRDGRCARGATAPDERRTGGG